MTYFIVIGVAFIAEEFANYVLSTFFSTAFPSFSKLILNRLRRNFFDTLHDPSFRKFKTEVLREYYSEEGLTNINHRTTPVFLFPYRSNACEEVRNTRERWIRKYDSIIRWNKEDNFKIDVTKHNKYKHFRGYHIFHLIMKENIQYPDRPCFMLKKLYRNNKNEIESLSVSIGTYGENAYSHQILEYELYRIYKKCKRIKNFDVKKEFKTIKNMMVLRNAKQRDNVSNIGDFLSSGEGWNSMLAVQMLVLIRNGDSFKVMIVQRSNTVAVAPGDYQMVPAGAFEIFNNKRPEYAEHEVISNLSPGAAVFREFLEEIIGESDCDGHGPGGVNEMLTSNKELQKIFTLLDNKEAAFRFLGVVADLTYLRHYLSFVLVISNLDYCKNTVFRGNDEAMNNAFLYNEATIDTIENNNELWDNLFPPSAGMWALFKQLIDNKDEELLKLLS